MIRNLLGSTGIAVSPIGFGAFKVGRSAGAKYPGHYEIPDDETAERLLHGVLDLGVNLIDTAPAYGLSEARIGRFLSARRHEFVLSTKAGEEFANGRSRFDFSRGGIEASVERSRMRLQSDVIDILFIHSDGNDRAILEASGSVDALRSLKARNVVRAIGFSGKTVDGARMALSWADVIMVEYHARDRSHEAVISEAHARRIGVFVKKGLGSGTIPASEALSFVLTNPAVTSVVVGTLNLDHLRENCRTVQATRNSAGGQLDAGH